MTVLLVALGSGALVLAAAVVLACRALVATALVLRILEGFAEDGPLQEAAGARRTPRPSREDAPARAPLRAYAPGATTGR